MSRVSIITPAFNSVDFLEETIKSVQNQTYNDWELIIVDDCSTDGTFELANSFSQKDSRIIVLRNDKNSGVSFSRNKAIDCSNGEYIAFLDSDDIWLPNKLEKQISFMEDNKYAFTYTDYKMFDSLTKVIDKKIIRAPDIMTSQKIYGNTSIGCLTVMVNRKIVGDFSMPLVNHMEDNITWQKIMERGYCGYRLPEVLSLYRKGNNNSLTSGKKKAMLAQWNIYRNYYNFSIFKSLFYFIQYAFHAIIKHYF